MPVGLGTPQYCAAVPKDLEQVRCSCQPTQTSALLLEAQYSLQAYLHQVLSTWSQPRSTSGPPVRVRNEIDGTHF